MVFTFFFVFSISFLINPNIILRGNRQKMPDFYVKTQWAMVSAGLLSSFFG